MESTAYHGLLAQLGERIAGSDEVRGSIPLESIPLRRQECRLFYLCVEEGESSGQSAQILRIFRESAQNLRIPLSPPSPLPSQSLPSISRRGLPEDGFEIFNEMRLVEISELHRQVRP